MGWLLFYAGITKVMNPDWTSAGYLRSAKTFSGFFQALLDPNILPFTDFINQWGLTLLGISLILGIGVRLSGWLGAILMMMYYFPALTFPHVGQNSYIVDEHIIYAIVLILLSVENTGSAYGFGNWATRTFPRLTWLLK